MKHCEDGPEADKKGRSPLYSRRSEEESCVCPSSWDFAVTRARGFLKVCEVRALVKVSPPQGRVPLMWELRGSPLCCLEFFSMNSPRPGGGVCSGLLGQKRFLCAEVAVKLNPRKPTAGSWARGTAPWSHPKDRP